MDIPASFKIYETEDGKIVSSQIVDTNGSGHGALAGFLADHGVEVLICGGIGMGAKKCPGGGRNPSVSGSVRQRGCPGGGFPGGNLILRSGYPVQSS